MVLFGTPGVAAATLASTSGSVVDTSGSTEDTELLNSGGKFPLAGSPLYCSRYTNSWIQPSAGSLNGAYNLQFPSNKHCAYRNTNMALQTLCYPRFIYMVNLYASDIELAPVEKGLTNFVVDFLMESVSVAISNIDAAPIECVELSNQNQD